MRRRIAGAHGDTDLGYWGMFRPGQQVNFFERRRQVAMDVIAEGLYRRNVQGVNSGN